MWKPIILDVECIVCNKSLQKINHDPEEVSRKMGKIANRRSRTPNWSVEEKQYLLELIKERREVVVTKTTNGPNYYEEKDVAWNEILTELTTKFGNKFCGSSIKKVKTQWQNMKRIAREEIAIHGRELDKYSRQSLEVCSILELVKDGVLKKDEENNISLNNTTMTTDVEIKAERIDDENQAGGSGSSSLMEMDQPLSTLRQLQQMQKNAQNESTQSYQLESSASSVSEQISEANDFDMQDEQPLHSFVNVTKKDVSSNTEGSFQEYSNMDPMHENMQQFLKYNSAEKQLKMESLKEERHVLRAMRETAELNKIIAEQRLKHVLWVKKQEMT